MVVLQAVPMLGLYAGDELLRQVMRWELFWVRACQRFANQDQRRRHTRSSRLQGCLALRVCPMPRRDLILVTCLWMQASMKSAIQLTLEFRRPDIVPRSLCGSEAGGCALWLPPRLPPATPGRVAGPDHEDLTTE